MRLNLTKTNKKKRVDITNIRYQQIRLYTLTFYFEAYSKHKKIKKLTEITHKPLTQNNLNTCYNLVRTNVGFNVTVHISVVGFLARQRLHYIHIYDTSHPNKKKLQT